MSRKYKFHEALGAYFISFATVNWIDTTAPTATIIYLPGLAMLTCSFLPYYSRPSFFLAPAGFRDGCPLSLIYLHIRVLRRNRAFPICRLQCIEQRLPQNRQSPSIPNTRLKVHRLLLRVWHGCQLFAK